MAKKAKTQKPNRYPLDIIICCDGMPFHGDSIKEHSLGGSETSALQMAKSLADIGNNVTVFSHCKGKEGIYDKVRYLDLTDFIEYATVLPHDVLIAQRIPELFTQSFNSKINILWQHDLSVHRNEGKFKAGIWNTDRCFVMSEFQKKQSMEVNGTPKEYYYITRNGIDLKLFKGEQPKRDPKKIIYGARPERGLDNLLFHVMPRLLQKDKDIKLYIATYDHKVPEMEGFYGSLRQQALKFPDNVIWLPPLTKKELYDHYKSASIYVFPSDFEEIYCISALEAMACGLPFIARDNAALKETLHPDAGILLSGFDSSKNPEFLDQFSNTILSLLKNSNLRNNMGKAGIKHSKECDWDSIAKEWIEEFYKIFTDNTKNKYTLARDFIFHSDIISAKKVMETMPQDSREKKMLEEDIKPWKINFDGYDVVGKMEDNNVFNYLGDIGGMEELQKVTREKLEPHWPMLDEWLISHPEVKTFMDYGCFTGRYAIPLANNNKDYFVYGVDVSGKTLDIAREISSELSKYNNIKFIQSSYEDLSLHIEEKVDCLLMFDILEHIINPENMIDKMEKFLNKDGWVIVITPSGPMEADGYGQCPHRIHLHEYSINDLRDMFRKKKGFGTTFINISGGSKVDNSKFGKICTTYQKSGIKTGKIDYSRKLLVRKSKQTLSACMIVKDEEDNIGKCIKKIKDYVDEIIVCDTGSTDKTKQIAEDLGARIIEGPDPLIHGFEASRNESIREAVSDWIMWIDADELFQDGRNMGKYLRNNIFDAYSIRQHHFSCSPPNAFKPDMPCRIFRNRKGIKFYGCLSGDTLIDMPRDLSKYPDGIPLKDLEGKKDFDVYSWDKDNQKLVLGNVNKVWKTKKNAEVWEIEYEWYGWGKKYKDKIIGTLDHRMMMRDGSYKEICELKAKDRLMPLNRRFDQDGYAHISVASIWEQKEHRFVLGLKKGDQKISHHKDTNKLNNKRDNLEFCSSFSEHGLKHAKQISVRNKKLFEDDAWVSKRNKNVSVGVRQSYIDGKSAWKKDWLKENNPSFREDVKIKHRYSAFIQFGNFKKAKELLDKYPWLLDMQCKTMTNEQLRKRKNRLSFCSSILCQGDANPNSKNFNPKAVKKQQQILAIADNHRVISIKKLNKKIDVYDMEVDKYHNFVANGVFSHNCIHEHPETALNKGPGLVTVLNDLEIAHGGYYTEAIRRERFQRNFPLMLRDRQKYPDRTLGKFFEIRDLLHLARYKLEQSKGQVTPEIAQWCHSAVSLYRKNFLGESHLMSSDAINFYSDALRILGLGFEMSWLASFGKDKAPLNGNIPKTIRFLDSEDANKYFSNEIKCKSTVFTSKYY